VNPDGKVIETATFGEIEKGSSFAKSNNNWTITTTPTPNSKNVITQSSNSGSSDSGEIFDPIDSINEFTQEDLLGVDTENFNVLRTNDSAKEIHKPEIKINSVNSISITLMSLGIFSILVAFLQPFFFKDLKRIVKRLPLKSLWK
jgi:hypothetical protein